jgi:hypothetical protein
VRRCDFCGRWFDEIRYQIIVPGLGISLDSVDCALSAFEESREEDEPRDTFAPLDSVPRLALHQ